MVWKVVLLGMPKVSVNILTKNRVDSLARALVSVECQSFKDWEVVIVNDGSSDDTSHYLENQKFKLENQHSVQIINHQTSVGITLSRQEALRKSSGEYIAILDDDDEWMDENKLKKQVEFLNSRTDYVLVGGGIKIEKNEIKFRPETDRQIRNWMLFKNPFFTSSVMFRRDAALKAGGFIKDDIDLGEDYDLWLRLLQQGKGYNFNQIFTSYRQAQYSREKRKIFLQKQLNLIKKYASSYPFYPLALAILKLRIML